MLSTREQLIKKQLLALWNYQTYTPVESSWVNMNPGIYSLSINLILYFYDCEYI